MRNLVAVGVVAGAIGAWMIGYSSGAAAVAASAPAADVALPAGPRQLASVEPEQVTLKVEGMTCGGCALSARIVLQRLEGVKKAEVSYEKKLAVVTYDAERITPAQMISALKEKLRYTATVVEAKET